MGPDVRRRSEWQGRAVGDRHWSFPCKGLSKVNSARENLQNKDSKLFWEPVRVLRDIRQAGKSEGDLRVCYIVGNVTMDDDPEQTITDKLGCGLVDISAGPVCVANRDGLF